MKEYLPGTTLPLPPGVEEGRLFAALEPIFNVSPGGLLLSQVTEMTGLNAATIQNWVKRGWVSNPVNKRYSELHVARILLINLLRPAMRLEQIAALLRCINGSVDDRTDDTIPEPQLYNLLASAIRRLERQHAVGRTSITALVRELLQDYSGPTPQAHDQLADALVIMLLNTAAADLMHRAEVLYGQIVATGDGPDR